MLRLLVRKTSQMSKVFEDLGINHTVKQAPAAKVKVNLAELAKQKKSPTLDLNDVSKLLHDHVSNYDALRKLPREVRDLAPGSEIDRKRREEVKTYADEFFDFRLNVGNEVLETDEEHPEIEEYDEENLFKQDSNDSEEEPQYPVIDPEEGKYLDEVVAPVNFDLLKACPEEYLNDPEMYQKWQEENEIPFAGTKQGRTDEIEPAHGANLGPITSEQTTMGISMHTFDSYLAAPNGEMFDPEDEEIMKDSNQSSHYTIGLDEGSSDDLPEYPERLHPMIGKAINLAEKWGRFTSVPRYEKGIKLLKSFVESQKTPAEWETQNIPSCLNYYELLPKYYKDQNITWSMVSLLDKRPDLTRKEKERALNILCFFLAPKNPHKYLFLQEYYAPKTSIDQIVQERETMRMKKGALVEDEFADNERDDNIYEADAELTEAEIAIKKIVGDDLTQKGGLKSVVDELPNYNIDWFSLYPENAKGQIPCPLTYYDNDDGYWDDWIKEKRERIGVPELSRRSHFKH
mmetsp:Transcript_17428/g.31451  ORF Transcript_17428/g.31451 Transcript_17428/m.31451 type:complete len:516 (-) Transcript_17428:4326-5873(-)